MVEFKVSPVLLSTVIVRPKEGSGDNSFDRTLKNLNNMVSEGRRCRIVSPTKELDLKETEEYRRYFCKRAKEDKVNYIYFKVPVQVFMEKTS